MNQVGKVELLVQLHEPVYRGALNTGKQRVRMVRAAMAEAKVEAYLTQKRAEGFDVEVLSSRPLA